LCTAFRSRCGQAGSLSSSWAISFLLYTDGVTEPENAAGDCFGDTRLEQSVRDNQFRPASELSERLLSEIQRWQPASITQQDDITLIVIDVSS
jgi:sigma-B regulation protein RsbU (phosphoserine phosphatase)